MATKDRCNTKIKKVGRTQSYHNDERATITSDTSLNGPGVNIKTRRKKKHKAKQVNVFERHFRIYFKNGHPAYIVDEEGNLYVFHRVTHSKTSGGRKNWKKENPLIVGGEKTTYIVKKEEKDKKNRFSPFILEAKPGVDISYPEIKKAGRSQNDNTSVINVNNNCTSIDGLKPSTSIKAKKKHKGKGKKNV